jgi:hypothetical protein
LLTIRATQWRRRFRGLRARSSSRGVRAFQGQ